MNIKSVSENSVIIYFSENIDINVSQKIRNVFTKISKIKGIVDLICSYTSILVVYDIFIFDDDSIKEELTKTVKSIGKIKESISYETLEIPTYYGLEVGIDLKELSKELNLSVEKIIEIHSSKLYDVFAIGFLPAFAYLGEVDKKIFTKRKESPRAKVLKGSVAIANTQTAIYPKNSPGGWNIIGKTPLNIFDKNLDNFSLINYFNKIKFNPISKEEFLSLGGKF